MTEPNFPRLARWLTDQLAARDWSVTDLANSSGLNRSGIQRWKGGTLRPDIDNARRLAEAFGRPLLEVLVAAEIITDDEARVRASVPDPAALTNEQLLVEVRRRLDSTSEKTVLTRDEIEANPDRYTAGPSTKPRPATPRVRTVHGGQD